MDIDQNLVKELGAQDMPEAVQAELVTRFYQNLNNRMGVALAETLTSEQRDTFLKVQQEEGDDKAIDWLTENVPSYPQIFEKEYSELVQELKDGMAAMPPLDTDK